MFLSGSTFSRSVSSSVPSDDDSAPGIKKRVGSPSSSLQNIPEEDKTDCASSQRKNKTSGNQPGKSREDILFRRQSSFDRDTFDSEDTTVTLTSLERAEPSAHAPEKENVINERDIDVEVEIKSPTKLSMFRREKKL